MHDLSAKIWRFFKIMENSGLKDAQNLLLVLHSHTWVYLIHVQGLEADTVVETPLHHFLQHLARYR